MEISKEEIIVLRTIIRQIIKNIEPTDEKFKNICSVEIGRNTIYLDDYDIEIIYCMAKKIGAYGI